jgi:N-acetylglucosamine-6-phosphate deacetylase
MMAQAISGAAIFDGRAWHHGRALLIEGDSVAAVLPVEDVPEAAEQIELEGGMLVPGFVDLQVNGGGGVLFNEDRTVGGLRRLCAAHFRFGTTALLPTLITDTREVTGEALAAGVAAAKENLPGFAGLHIEGPHLSLARKGAHNPDYIRTMEADDISALKAAKAGLPTLLTTVAVEAVAKEQISELAGAGIMVSLGHTDAGYAKARAAFEAGASMATHLFNAMSQLGNREPGLVGAVLESGAWAGLIADGIHVDPASIAIALRAKNGPGRIFLVTDAMSPIGTNMERFTLNGREIVRKDGALRLADGTLAGADLTMIDAVRFVHRTIRLPLDEVLRMASLYPAQAIGRAERLGHLGAGAEASIVHLSDDLAVEDVWVAGGRIAL